jgi:hypothetical protein
VPRRMEGGEGQPRIAGSFCFLKASSGKCPRKRNPGSASLPQMPGPLPFSQRGGEVLVGQGRGEEGQCSQEEAVDIGVAADIGVNVLCLGA